jgi:hypothetical protein
MANAASAEEQTAQPAEVLDGDAHSGRHRHGVLDLLGGDLLEGQNGVELIIVTYPRAFAVLMNSLTAASDRSRRRLSFSLAQQHHTLSAMKAERHAGGPGETECSPNGPGHFRPSGFPG